MIAPAMERRRKGLGLNALGRYMMATTLTGASAENETARAAQEKHHQLFRRHQDLQAWLATQTLDSLVESAVFTLQHDVTRRRPVGVKVKLERLSLNKTYVPVVTSAMGALEEAKSALRLDLKQIKLALASEVPHHKRIVSLTSLLADADDGFAVGAQRDAAGVPKRE
jgi:hypothetical protein